MQTALASEIAVAQSTHTLLYTKQLLMFLPINRPVVSINPNDEIPPNPLNLPVRQSTSCLHEALDASVLPTDERQGTHHSLRPRANHPLGSSTVPLERTRPRQVPDELGAAMAQAKVGQRVVVGDGFVGHAAQRQHERA